MLEQGPKQLKVRVLQQLLLVLHKKVIKMLPLILRNATFSQSFDALEGLIEKRLFHTVFDQVNDDGLHLRNCQFNQVFLFKVEHLSEIRNRVVFGYFPEWAVFHFVLFVGRLRFFL